MGQRCVWGSQGKATSNRSVGIPSVRALSTRSQWPVSSYVGEKRLPS